MKASVIYQYGGPEEFKYEEYPDPVPGAGEVLVRVAAASINPVDLFERTGMLKDWKPLRFPGVIGWDMAGTVIELGPDVENLLVGDRVLAWTYHTYAELCVVNTQILAKVPEGVDLLEAATLPLVGTTGSQLISVASGLRSGQTVLISGAAGGVGRAAVYTAKQMGAFVIAGVRRSQLDSAADMGADRFVALDDEKALSDLEAVDIVANTVRGKTAEWLLGKVKKDGVFASVTGAPDNANDYPSVKVNSFVSKQDAATLLYCATGLRQGKLRIPIDRKLPLSKARQGHEAMQQGVDGKILLIP